jgi:hypothetical protein
MSDLFENPLGLYGFEFFEISATAKGTLEPAFERMGFGAVEVTRSPVAGRRAGNAEYPLRLLRGAETLIDSGWILALAGEEL